VRVEVEVEGDFGAEGEPAQNVTYRARIAARGQAEEIRAMAEATDSLAEIQNTLRAITPVQLAMVEIEAY
jgi:hypothetical protein